MNQFHKPTVRERLESTLPAIHLTALRVHVMDTVGCTRVTYWRFLNSDDPQSLPIAKAIAEYLGCTIDQVIDPDHVFTLPKAPFVNN